MTVQSAAKPPLDSPWPHRLAVVLVCATFPLLFVGGFVTTYDAGMAVPDWPNTFGYNLFLYPWQTWIAGPWNIFVEHGHRMLGALTGFLTIGLVAAVYLRDERRWMRYFVSFALMLVVAQGVLGGQRVVLDQRTLAMIHGCVGPLFFATAAALAVFTSRRWRTMTEPRTNFTASSLQRLALTTTLLAYVQLVAGACVRHFPADGTSGGFRAAVIFHLVLAAILAVHVVWLTWRVMRWHRSETAIRKPALRLAAFTAAQLLLGASTWVLKYNWPDWAGDLGIVTQGVVERRAFGPAIVTTLHVAVGSLIVVTALSISLWSLRAYRVGWSAADLQTSPPQGTEVLA